MKYQSDKMVSRRQRILETVQALLSRNDGQFTMRELARESGVATATLYNLYGSQGALIADAVADIFERRVNYSNGDPAAETISAAITSRHKAAYDEILREPAFARKMVEIFFNSDAGDPTHDMLLRVPANFGEQQLLMARNAGDLADWVNIPVLADQMARANYATINAWAHNEFEDAELYPRILYSSFFMIVGALTGDSRRDVEQALADIKQQWPGADQSALSA